MPGRVVDDVSNGLAGPEARADDRFDVVSGFRSEDVPGDNAVLDEHRPT